MYLGSFHPIRRIDRHASVRHVSNKGFRKETQLVSFFLQHLDEVPHVSSTGSRCILRELTVDGGKPDLIIARIRGKLRDKHLYQTAPSKLTRDETIVLAALNAREGKPVLAISAATMMPEKRLQQHLRSLIKRGLVAQTKAKNFRLAKPFPNFLERVVAVEAKLVKWQEALAQATRNALFADYSYVVLDKSKANGALHNASEFRKMGIGLLLADILGSCIIRAVPGKNSRRLSRVYRLIMHDAALEVIRGA